MSPSFRADAFCIFVGLILSFSSNFQNGYSTTYTNTPVDEFKVYLNESLHKMGYQMTVDTYNTIWNLILNIPMVGFFTGIWISPLLNDRFGRKVLRFAGIYFHRPDLLFVSQYTISICSAVTYQSLILYLQESGPTKLRGLLAFLSDIMLSTMCMVGMLMGTQQLLGKDLRWLAFLSIPPAIFSCVVLFFIPETPKFLLINKKDEKSAEKAVRFFHGRDVDASAVLREIEQEATAEDGDSFFKICREIVGQRHLRSAVYLGIACLQNCVGMWSLLLSSTYFLQQSDVRETIAEWSSTGMMVFYIVGTVLGSGIIEVFGRRPLYLSLTLVNVLSQVVFVVFDKLHPLVDSLKFGCIVSLAVYGFTYGLATGPISNFIAAELVPQNYRSSVQTLCFGVNTVMIVISTFTVLPLYHAIGSYSFLVLYVVPSLLCLLYIHLHLPETKGKEIHEIVRELKGNGQ